MRRLYDWVMGLAQHRYAIPLMGVVSFAESSFFPIPPDVMLIPMAIARPDKAWFYATVCTGTSVAGGLLGYLIGALIASRIVLRIEIPRTVGVGAGLMIGGALIMCAVVALGIAGFGRIGQEVAPRARAFGMRVVAHDPFIAQEVAESMGVELLSLDELVAKVDAVTADDVAAVAGDLLRLDRLSAAGIGPSESRFRAAIERVNPALVERAAA